MIEMRYGDVNNPEKMEAFMKVASYTGFTAQTAWRVGKMRGYLEAALKRLTEKKRELAKKYGEVDEKGNPVLEQSDQPGMSRLKIKPEHKAAYDEALQAYYHELFEMKVRPIPFAELEKAQLSPEEMYQLDGLVDGVPDEESEQK